MKGTGGAKSPSPVMKLDKADVTIPAQHHLPPPLGGYTFVAHLRSALTHDTFSARADDDNEEVVVRIYALEYLRRDEDCRRMIERETLIARMVDHPHIVKAYPPFMTKTDLFLVQKSYGGGELYEALESYSRSTAMTRGSDTKTSSFGLPVTIVKRLTRELASALQYLHETCDVAHRNIKLENIALDEENGIRLGGLGMCAVLPAHHASTTVAAAAAGEGDSAHSSSSSSDPQLRLCCGSKHYVAPEIVEGVGYDGAGVDVWAAGVVLFALLTGSFPFDSETSEEEIFQKIKNADKSLEENALFRAIDDPQAKDLVRNMLRVNAKARFSVAEVLEHPYLH